MSEPVNQSVLELVRKSSLETRGAIFEELLRELMKSEPVESEIPLYADNGDLLGFFVRAYALAGASPETEQAIKALRDRHGEFDPRELISADEFIRQLSDRSPVGSR
jgi:hypothetical protein